MINQADLLSTLNGVVTVLTLFLGSIAGISLLVGGIGIMNIMLVSVTERTREIGIRKAVGAQQGDILRQFLIEAILISVGGGLLGILLGVRHRQMVNLTGAADLRSHARGGAAGGGLLAGRRPVLRHLPGAARGPARPDRGATLRVVT